jgi:hypothetical protein
MMHFTATMAGNSGKVIPGDSRMAYLLPGRRRLAYSRLAPCAGTCGYCWQVAANTIGSEHTLQLPSMTS